MFLGQHQHTLDKNTGLRLPAHFARWLVKGAYITQGFERNLLVLTAETFQTIYEQVMAMNLTNPLARLLLRMILGNASPLAMDKSGNILIPEHLRAFASLKDDIVLVGQGDYFEIWSAELWQKQIIQLQDAEANAQRFASLTLAAR